MIIGIPKESKDLESRVGLTPKWVDKLTKQGHSVFMEKGLGNLARISDSEYEKCGAKVLNTVEEIYEQSEMIVKLKDYVPEERGLPFQEGQIIVCYFHLGEIEPDQPFLDIMLEKKVNGVSLELIRDKDGGRPTMKPMSEIAGRLAVLSACRYSMLPEGNGVSLAAMDGLNKPKIVILGGGISGTAAAKVCEGLGARTIVFEALYTRIEYLATVLTKSELLLYDINELKEHIKDCDVLINTIYPVPGMKFPIVTRDMVKTMKKRAVIVDITGCDIIETSRYTTISDPIYEEEGVIHFGVDNLPAMVPQTSCEAFAQTIFPYVEAIANKGIKKACEDNEELAVAVSFVKGKLVHKDIADTHNMPYEKFTPAMFE